MGRLADFFREQNITLAGQQKTKMLSLDREFEQMEAKLNVLESENLKLQAEVNPLKRQIDRMQDQVQRAEADLAARNEKLDEKAEALLVAIAHAHHVSEGRAETIVKGTRARAEYYLGLLKERRLIRYSGANYTVDGRYVATQEGLEYLQKIGKL